MPRKGRLHIDSGCYHVMGHGLERRTIFDDEGDKDDFITRLSASLPATEISCLA